MPQNQYNEQQYQGNNSLPMEMPNKQQEMMNILDGMPITERTNQPRMQDDTDMLQILLTKDEFKNGDLLTNGLKKTTAFYEKTLALSNIKREDIFWIMEGAKDMKVAYLMTRPKDLYTWEEEFLWTGFVQWLRLEATRGVDGFERHMQATQITQNSFENRQTRPAGGSGGGIMGFLGKAFSGSRG